MGNYAYAELESSDLAYLSCTPPNYLVTRYEWVQNNAWRTRDQATVFDY